MIHEQESREVVALAFRAAKFGESELTKAIKVYMWHRRQKESGRRTGKV